MKALQVSRSVPRLGMARIASVFQPCPPLMNLSGMIRTLAVTPATPMPLSRSAPMIPATCVPWEWLP